MIQANLLLSRPFIKINACLIGYGLWIILGQHQIITNSVHIPLCFYKVPHQSTIIAPDTIKIIVSAPRKVIHRLDVHNSAIHLDASKFIPGNNHLLLEKENLFLPDEINLVDLIPSHVQIQLQKNE